MKNIDEIKQAVENRVADEQAAATVSAGGSDGGCKGHGGNRTRNNGQGNGGGNGSGRPGIPDGPDEITPDFLHECLWLNAVGDAMVFAALHRHQFIFNKSADSWMYWSGSHWKTDKMGLARVAVDDVAKTYGDEAMRLRMEAAKLVDDDPQKESLEKKAKMFSDRAWALRSGPRREMCLSFAHTIVNPMAITGDEIDKHPWKLACANGVLNLRTGEMEPGRREDYLFRASPVQWAGIDTPAPVWEKTLGEIFEDNKSLIDFVQRIFGLALAGESMRSMLVVLAGIGRNGKSTIIETTAEILGDLAGSIRSEMLLDQRRTMSSSGPTPDIMALKGIRYAFASETDDGCRISTSRVKWLTGNDTLTGRNPHDKYEINFKPTHTLFLSTNHIPHAPADDFAFWERVLILPFKVSFVDRMPQGEWERRSDPTLKKRLRAESAGILAWLVKGCLLAQREGIDPPAIVTEAVKDKRRNEDWLADFIEECCYIDEAAWCGATQIYQVFERWWWKNVSKNAPRQKSFGGLMSKRFRREKDGVYKYFGIGLADTEYMDDTDD